MAKKPKETNEAEQVVEEVKEEPETYTLTHEQMQQAKEHIEGLQKQKDEVVELLQRNQADFDNYRKRNAQIRADSIDEGRRECFLALLPILDDFERLFNNAENADKAWQDGVRLIHKKLLEALEKLGLEEIEADGKFDPAVHNAVLVEQAEDRESGEVLSVLQKGYRAKDRVIRPAMVKVSQ
ncbi:MAG: nucleotide exchange factor GrpE [Clostridia bacterium]|nr:nucleotide exchange factor GrpE [Clostridia bacterium]